MIDIDISVLVPHEGRIVLIDNVLEYSSMGIVCDTVVRDDGLFGDAEAVPAWLGIEYMAQTVAAYSGMQCHLAGQPINVGFLVGTRRYSSNISEIKVGSYLKVQVNKLYEDQGLAVFDCHISGSGIGISSKLNVFLPRISTNTLAN